MPSHVLPSAASADRAPVCCAAAIKAHGRSIRSRRERNPQIEPALPISLTSPRLPGSAWIQGGARNGPCTAHWLARACEGTARAPRRDPKGVGRQHSGGTMEQPAADLLISVTPGLRKLVEAAVPLGP